MFTGELPEIGQPDPKLVSIRRRVENSRHVFPEEQVALVENYWGRDIWKGWSLRDTTKQIVVDLCKEPITYGHGMSHDVSFVLSLARRKFSQDFCLKDSGITGAKRSASDELE